MLDGVSREDRGVYARRVLRDEVKMNVWGETRINNSILGYNGWCLDDRKEIAWTHSLDLAETLSILADLAFLQMNPNPTA